MVNQPFDLNFNKLFESFIQMRLSKMTDICKYCVSGRRKTHAHTHMHPHTVCRYTHTHTHIVTAQSHGHPISMGMLILTDILSTPVIAGKMPCIIMARNRRLVIKAIWMATGPFLRRLYGTTRDTKEVSKTTDTEYSAALLHPVHGYGLWSRRAFIFKMYTLIWHWRSISC